MKYRALEGISTQRLYEVRKLLEISREVLIRRNAAQADIKNKRKAMDIVDNELRRRGEFPGIAEQGGI